MDNTTNLTDDWTRIEYVMKNAILPCGAVGYDTASQLAKDLNIRSVQMLYDIKQGKYKISKTLARRINARFPDCPAEWLLTGQGTPPAAPLFMPAETYKNQWWQEEGADADLYTNEIFGRWELRHSLRCDLREPGKWKEQVYEQIPGWEFDKIGYVILCQGLMRMESSRYAYDPLSKKLSMDKFGCRLVTKLTDTEMILLDWSGMECGYMVKEVYTRTDGIPEKGPMLEITLHRISMP